MNQTDIINKIANDLLKVTEIEIDGRIYKSQIDSSERSINYMISEEYAKHGKLYRGDPTRMIEKIKKIVNQNESPA